MCVVVVVARRRKGCAIIARGEKNNNIFVSSLLSSISPSSSSSPPPPPRRRRRRRYQKCGENPHSFFLSRLENIPLQNTMSIIRRHHCPHTTKDRCRRVLLGREGSSSSGGGHFGGMVVSSQAAAPSFCDRVHFRPVLRVGFTKTSLGMCVILLVLYLLCVRVRFRASLTQNFVSFLSFCDRVHCRPVLMGWMYHIYFCISCVYTSPAPDVAHTKLCVFSFLKTHDIIIKRRRIV